MSNPNHLLQPKHQFAAYRAMKWMAEDDPAELAFPSLYYQSAHAAKMSRHREEEAEGWRDDSFFIQQLLQRYALATFYFGLDDDTAQGQTTEDVVAAANHELFRKSWLSKDHVCHWHGVDCSSYGRGDKAGVESVHLSTVVRVNLTRHNLGGRMPMEWFSGVALPDLTSVDLSHNSLFGTLPDSNANAGEQSLFLIHQWRRVPSAIPHQQHFGLVVVDRLGTYALGHCTQSADWDTPSSTADCKALPKSFSESQSFYGPFGVHSEGWHWRRQTR